MIAYNETALDNLFVQQQTIKAYKQGFISKEEKNAIDLQYPVACYTPNVFVRCGLFILTMIITWFTIGTFSLFFIDGIDKVVSLLGICFSIALYAAMEYMIKTKKHYHSGVDDALLYQFIGCLYASVLYLINVTAINTNSMGIVCCIILFIITAFVSVRFANMITSLVAYLSLLGVLFFTCARLGGIAKAIAPLILMAAAAFVYVPIKILFNKSTEWRHYKKCLQVVTAASLLSFYIAGNYFIVRELSNSMFGLNLLPGQTIPFGWLFWIFTVSIPFIYLFFGIKNKDAILIRVSLLLFAATIFTIRNYYTIAPVETAMIVAGILLIAGCYGLIRFLEEPKHGFTCKALYADDAIDKLQIESLLIAQSFTHRAANSDATKFGGGSFGGGGATGEY